MIELHAWLSPMSIFDPIKNNETNFLATVSKVKDPFEFKKLIKYNTVIFIQLTI